jgi:hypothetical protein
LNVHNQCKGINLTSPVSFIHGGKLHVIPDQEIDDNIVMQNRLEFDTGQDMLEGALVYRIQRKHTEFVQNESNPIWLLVAWHCEHTERLHVRALLVEHNNELNEDRLKRLYQKYWPLLKTRANTIKSNWALDGTTKLVTTIKVMNGGYRWDIFISGGR